MRARLAEYEASHRSSANEACHFVGIPLIITGAAPLLALVQLTVVGGYTLTVADVIGLAILAFYVTSARWLGVVTGVIFVVLVTVGRLFPWGVGLGLFLGGWALQFLGHALFEKTSPAFLKNLLHLLVGPAWLVQRALGRV